MGKSIAGTLSYNEQKVQKEQAKLIVASGFGCDIADLGFTQKLQRFTNLTELNEWVKKNTLHISLNFSPEEKISTRTMQAIARDYMDKIGFSAQPFLVYQHFDAKHPHIHIITTNVTAKRKAISLHNIAKDRSEPARKAIELQYDLVQAESRKQFAQKPPTAMELLPAVYGKSETKHVITNIVTDVLQSYMFASLAEYNAILREFNIVADRGQPGSRQYDKGGLVYSLLDDQGGRTGLSIKASDIYGAPTLKVIEEKFAQNLVKKIALKPFVTKGVADSMTFSRNAAQFLSNIERRRLSLEFLPAGSAQPIQAIVVDYRNKTAFAVEDLGISTIELMKKLEVTQRPPIQRPAMLHGSQRNNPRQRLFRGFRYRTFQPFHIFIRILFSPTRTSPGGAVGLPKRKKRRRRPPL